MLSWYCKCFFCFFWSTFHPCSSPAAVARLILHDSDPKLSCDCLFPGSSLVCTWFVVLSTGAPEGNEPPLGFACARRCCNQDTQTCAEQSLNTKSPAEHRELPTPQSTKPLCCCTATTSGEELGSVAPGHILYVPSFLISPPFLLLDSFVPSCDRAFLINP